MMTTSDSVSTAGSANLTVMGSRAVIAESETAVDSVAAGAVDPNDNDSNDNDSINNGSNDNDSINNGSNDNDSINNGSNDNYSINNGSNDNYSINNDSNDNDSNDAETAKTLWEALIQARSQSPVISAAEDAVFRFYLPLARATARTYVGWAVDPDLAEHAAELGLANAVLAWRRADICAFAAFARAAMIRQMSASANARARRLRPPIPAQEASVT